MFKNISNYNAPLLLSLIILNLLDFVTTYYCLSMGATEGNPILSHFMEQAGTVWVILYIKIALVAVLIPYFIVAAYYPKTIKQYVRPTFTTFTAYLLIAVNIMYFYVVGNNLHILSILTNLQ